MTMTNDSPYFQVARRLLEAPQLSLGCQTINALPESSQEEALGGFPGEFAWYVVHTAPLERPATCEHLLLFSAPPTGKAVRSAFTLATRMSKCARLVCVVPDGPQDLTLNANEGITIWSAKQFFHHVLRLPETFMALLRGVAAIERPDEFPIAFQDRRATFRSIGAREGALRNVNALDFFESWLGAHHRVSPVLLLGERGLGKSWQSLQFAQAAYTLHERDPWRYGPAFFIKLRELVNLVEQSNAATPVLLQYILSRYSGLKFGLGGVASLGALIAIGHSVACVDGFDEMDTVPTDSRVRARLTELLMILSRKTRFILSSRPGHFTSLEALLNTESWSGATIGEAFDILELLPYDDPRSSAYIDATAPEIWPSLSELLGGEDPDNRTPLQHALWVCASHPGMLARIKDLMQEEGIKDPRLLVQDAITSIRINFNLAEGRTRRSYQAADGSWVDLSAERREEILADIAWYMAERKLEALDLSQLPPRIRLSYKIEDDALQRDLRSQTVLELAPLSAQQSHPQGEPEDLEGGPGKSPLHLDDVSARSLVRFTLRDDGWRHTEPGEISVTWSYYLARYVAEKLVAKGPCGNLQADVRLRHLGRIPFGPTVAALLRELLEEKGMSLAQIGDLGASFLRSQARSENFRVFSPWYRHLAKNLAMLSALHDSYANALDPWSADVLNIVRQPGASPDYEFAVVPPVDWRKDRGPFLLGVHEVTNRQYLAFIRSTGADEPDPTVNGREWAVERMTVAAGRRGDKLSVNHLLSNEYHLFFWLPPRPETLVEGEEERSRVTDFRPPRRTLGRPVTYVSWFAAAAYCDWLSLADGFPRFYDGVLYNALGRKFSAKKPASNELVTFRLPTKEEWIWAARGGHQDVQRAWELYPYYLPYEERRKVLMGGEEVPDEKARLRYVEAQKVVKAILLDPYKQSGDVVHDEPNDFGVAGLIGNVREWCHSTQGEESQEAAEAVAQRLILGATGYLGESTFNFEYEAPLYPRNTNPDVGFRVSRTLSSNEVEVLRAREAAICNVQSK
jgi:formylglycine-generating enzyme required for sulfatase activity